MERSRALQLAVERGDVGAVRTLCEEAGSVPNHLRFRVWELLLGCGPEGLDPGTPNTSSSKLSRAYSVVPGSAPLSDDDQHTIRADARRTRSDLALFRKPQTVDLLVSILTSYCTQRGVPYTQGLNEILAPFVFLASPPYIEAEITSVFTAFVDRFVASLYGSNFRALQSLLLLFRLLLQYADPRLSLLLDRHGLVPELYATSWALTLFSRTFSAQLLMRLWDHYLLDRRRSLHVYVMVAFLRSHREKIMGETDSANLPLLVSRLELEGSAAQLDALVAEARRLREATPASFGEAIRNCLLKGCRSTAVADAQLATLRGSPTLLLGGAEALRGIGRRVADSLEPEGARRHMSRRFVFLDCRGPEAFGAGHLPDSVCLTEALRAASEAARSAVGSGEHEDEQEEADRRCYELFVRELQLRLPADEPHYCLVTAPDELSERKARENVLWLLQHGMERLCVLVGGFQGAHKEIERVGGVQALDLIDGHQPRHCAPCVAAGFERLLLDF